MLTHSSLVLTKYGVYKRERVYREDTGIEGHCTVLFQTVGCVPSIVSQDVLPLIAVHVTVVLNCHCHQQLCEVINVLRTETGPFRPLRTLSSIRSSSDSSAIVQQKQIPLVGFG
jgi:hypothetical protein